MNKEDLRYQLLLLASKNQMSIPGGVKSVDLIIEDARKMENYILGNEVD